MTIKKLHCNKQQQGRLFGLLLILPLVMASIVPSLSAHADTLPPEINYESTIGVPTLNNPSGIALDTTGRIYVADTENHRIQIFNPDGSYHSQFGTEGSGDGQLAYPSAIALDTTGRIYVADSSNNRIQIFNPDGSYHSQFGTEGSGDSQLAYPFGIALDTTGRIYVADADNSRIQIFNPDGSYHSQFGTFGDGDGEFSSPRGVALDTTGRIYVADTDNDRIQIFNPDGSYHSQFGTFDAGDDELKYPSGIALDTTGRIYVADTNNNRIQILSTNFYPAPTAADPTVSLPDGTSLTGVPTITARPTFTGTAMPGANITVHVGSLTCTATANHEGDWSCVIPRDLSAGNYTVRVHIANPDGSHNDLGPYTVTVAARGSGAGATHTPDNKTPAKTNDSNTPLAPNAGLFAYIPSSVRETHLIQWLIGGLSGVLCAVGVSVIVKRHRSRSLGH